MDYESPQQWDQSAGRLKRQLALTWILMLLLAVFWVIPSFRNWFQIGAGGEPRAVTPRGELANFEKTTVDLFDQVSPSVVYINTKAAVRNRFTRRLEDRDLGTGSGFVWDSEGHIVTNFHVVQDADFYQVVFHDQSSYDARLVASSPNYDLAVLKVNAPLDKLKPVLIGESQDLKVGQSVFAIGNPFGLHQTLTTGIVSSKSRAIESPGGATIDDVIQIDAAINPGNSGGPLLDSAGRLIGVNTAIYSPSGASAGVGFAVPVDSVNRVVPQIIQKGKYEPARLGIRINEYYNERLKRLTGINGVAILELQPGGAAAAAGLRECQLTGRGGVIMGDVIQKVGDVSVETVQQFEEAMLKLRRGQEVTFTFVRDDQIYEVDITLD